MAKEFELLCANMQRLLNDFTQVKQENHRLNTSNTHFRTRHLELEEIEKNFKTMIQQKEEMIAYLNRELDESKEEYEKVVKHNSELQ